MRLFVLFFWCSNGIRIDGLGRLLCSVKLSENSSKSKKPIQVIFCFFIDLLVCKVYPIELSFVLSQKGWQFLFRFYRQVSVRSLLMFCSVLLSSVVRPEKKDTVRCRVL